jgi:hypothetical protein
MSVRWTLPRRSAPIDWDEIKRFPLDALEQGTHEAGDDFLDRVMRFIVDPKDVSFSDANLTTSLRCRSLESCALRRRGS